MVGLIIVEVFEKERQKMTRSVRDFVKEMVQRGRDDSQIVAVTRCTRWSNSMEDVKYWLERRGERWRKNKDE